MQNTELKQNLIDTDSHLKYLLANSKTIAIIGCSSNPGRTSRRIAGYLKKSGFNIIPVNPNEDRILGEYVYNSIEDVPDNIRIDIVNIFRNKKYTAGMVKEIVNRFNNAVNKPLIWTQLDVSSTKAKEMALQNDFQYVENRCIYVDHKELVK
ncbi:MAG: CoA-binding protein [Balneolaceae bacterium]